MAHALIPSPIGPLSIVTTDRGVARLDFVHELNGAPIKSRHRDAAAAESLSSERAIELVDEATRQLEEYFAGERRVFDLPLDLRGTPFQVRVWQSIAAIPYGETLSYAGVALAAGRPNAYRAAGTACGANRLVILVPCHRVIGSDRGLHGFGGGLDTKIWLLRHERAAIADALPQRPVLLPA